MEHATAAGLLAIVAMAIIVAPTLAGWLRLPGIIGLVLAGALVGPYILGLLPAGAIDGLGAVGLLYLMFQAGLEIDLATFRKHRRSAVVFGLLTFGFPLALGAYEGFRLAFPAAAAILIGSIWASHTLVTLPDVREMGLSASRVATTVAGATVITDTLALLILAVAASVAEGGNVGAVVGKLSLGLVVLAAWTMWALPKLGARYFVHSGRERVLRFAWLVFALASSAVVAEAFGIEGLVGAFLAGLGINHLVPNHGTLMERVDFFGAALLVPAFLIYVGTRLDPSVVVQLQTVRLAALFLAALVVGKAVAAVVGGLVLRFSLAESGLMFGMSVPQAAATLAAALVGARVGLFDDQVVNAVVLVVLVSILVGSLSTRFFARRVEMPAPSTAPPGDKVILGIGEADPVAPLAQLAAGLSRNDDGTVTAVAVALTERDVDDAEGLAEEAEKTALAYGADAEARVRRSGSMDRALLETVVEERASTLLVTWKPSDAAWMRAFGSQVDRIGRESPVPVIAARFGQATISSVVLATDSITGPPARRYDAKLAARVAEAAATVFEAPLVASVPDEETADGLSLEEDVKVLVGGRRPVTGRPELFGEGVLLVVTAELVRRVGGNAASLLRRHPGVSVLVVAGPHRLRLGAMTGSTARDYLGYHAGAAVDVAGE